MFIRKFMQNFFDSQALSIQTRPIAIIFCWLNRNQLIQSLIREYAKQTDSTHKVFPIWINQTEKKRMARNERTNTHLLRQTRRSFRINRVDTTHTTTKAQRQLWRMNFEFVKLSNCVLFTSGEHKNRNSSYFSTLNSQVRAEFFLFRFFPPLTKSSQRENFMLAIVRYSQTLRGFKLLLKSLIFFLLLQKVKSAKAHEPVWLVNDGPF